MDETGISSYNNEERLQKFTAWIEDDAVWVDADEIGAWERENPQPYDRDAYQGLYADVHGGPEEPHFRYIQQLAREGLEKLGHHGRVSAMGVPRDQLPKWDDIQILAAHTPASWTRPSRERSRTAGSAWSTSGRTWI